MKVRNTVTGIPISLGIGIGVNLVLGWAWVVAETMHPASAGVWVRDRT